MVGGLKRFLWHNVPLPQWLRRRVEEYYLYPRLPRPKAFLRTGRGNVFVAGCLQSGLGLGEAARLSVQALREQGVSLQCHDLSKIFGIFDLPNPDFADTESGEGDGGLLLHMNAPETGRALKHLGTDTYDRRHVIGYWAWELENAQPHWRRAYQYLDELWVPTAHAAKAFSDCPVPVNVVPYPVREPASKGLGREAFGLDDREVVFLCMGDSRSDFERKNLPGTIRAFKKAFAGNDSVRLVVKVHHEQEDSPAMQTMRAESVGCNVSFMAEMLERGAVGDLLRACDVFVSLHRAEGFGLPMAEAMWLGKPVVATNYSGNVDFMTAACSMPVEYRLVPVQNCSRNYAEVPDAHWAEPDIDHAARCMQKLAESDDMRRSMGEAGRQQAASFFSPARFAENFTQFCEYEHS